jgi:hypothetical protein
MKTRPAHLDGLSLALLVLCLALGGIVYLELADGPVDPPANAATAAAPRRPEAPPAHEAKFAMAAIEEFAETVKRPPFAETRRPAPPEQRRENLVDLSNLSLIGIVSSAAGRRALIEHGKPPQVERLVEGQTIEGWTVEAIRPNLVLVRRGETTGEIKIIDKAPVLGQVRLPQPAPAPPPAGQARPPQQGATDEPPARARSRIRD